MARKSETPSRQGPLFLTSPAGNSDMLGGSPIEEVGKTLGIDPATARVYRRHAVVKLAALLGEGSESCLS